MKVSVQRMGILLVAVLVAPGCSVWHTDSSYVERQTSEGGTAIDKTRTRDGLPYFLPKGMIRLVIKPGDPPVTQSATKEAAATPAKEEAPPKKAMDPAALEFLNFGLEPATPQENQANPPPPKDPEDPDKAVKVVAYSVSMEVKMVPDTEGGVFYAHYSPNWLFDDNTAISVTKSGLLNTVSSTVEDRTGQIIQNLAETAVEVGKFFAGASGGLPLGEVFSSEQILADTSRALTDAKNDKSKITQLNEKVRDLIAKSSEAAGLVSRLAKTYPIEPPPPPHIKRLNVNEFFDPLDKKQRDHIKALFATSRDERNPVYSPLDVSFICGEPKAGTAAHKAGPRATGLWFREPLEVEIKVTFNSDLERAIQKALDTLKAHAPKMRKDGQALVALEGAIPESLKALEEAKGQVSEDVKLAVDAAIRELKIATKQLPALREDFDATKKAYAQQTQNLRIAYAGSHLGETAGLGRFTATVANKMRSYSLNVPRSAFIKRTMTVQIDSGMLLGFGHAKPSEIEGFTEIPLELAKKLAGVPKALWTARGESLQSQNTAITNETNVVNSQKGLEGARFELEKARLENERARIQLEKDRIAAEKAAKAGKAK